jgi:NAD(P)-dependent dehydrogenase (short-subunit alcohol dehydrogenase family)
VKLPQSQPRHIISILDQRVWNLTPHFMTYTLTKSALWTLTQTLALSLAPHIRVNAIGPGPTLPNVQQSEQDFKRQYDNIPLQSPTNLVDLAKAIFFLIETPSITGQMIALDGGQHLGWSFPNFNQDHLYD